MAPEPPETDVIRASEIGEYVYCARAWWLHRLQGVESRNSAALQHGQRVHDQHGRAVARFQMQQRLALALVGLALVTGLLAALLALGVR